MYFIELERQAVIEESLTGELSSETVRRLESEGYAVEPEIEPTEAEWQQILQDTANARKRLDSGDRVYSDRL
jgi:hypothetical protein